MKIKLFIWIPLALCCISAVQGEYDPSVEISPEDGGMQIPHHRVIRSNFQGRQLVRFDESGEHEVKQQAEAFFPNVPKSHSGEGSKERDGSGEEHHQRGSRRKGHGSRRKGHGSRRKGHGSRPRSHGHRRRANRRD